MFHNPEFWVLVSFLAFLFLFGGKLWGAIAGALDGRAVQIRAELGEAQRLRQEAETMLADAERARTEALAEAAAAEAEASAKRREQVALDRISAAERAAIADVRAAAADIATRAAERVIAAGLGEDRETAMLDAAIADLPRALRAA